MSHKPLRLSLKSHTILFHLHSVGQSKSSQYLIFTEVIHRLSCTGSTYKKYVTLINSSHTSTIFGSLISFIHKIHAWGCVYYKFVPINIFPSSNCKALWSRSFTVAWKTISTPLSKCLLGFSNKTLDFFFLCHVLSYSFTAKKNLHSHLWIWSKQINQNSNQNINFFLNSLEIYGKSSTSNVGSNKHDQNHTNTKVGENG